MIFHRINFSVPPTTMSEKKSKLPGVLSEKEVARIAKEELNEDPDRLA